MAQAGGHVVSLQAPSLVGANLPKIGSKCCCSSSASPSNTITATLQLRADKKKDTTTSIMMSVKTQGRVGGRTGGGAGVLERPGLDQSRDDNAPRTEEGGEMGKSRQTVRFGGGDRFRVLLLDHERHTESHVAKVIPRVVPNVSPDEARKCFHESRQFGFGVVTIAVREHAEFYVQMLTRFGLRSTIDQNGTVV